MKELIKITKEEAMAVRAKAPMTHIAITNRQKPYKSYYMEESDEGMAVICEMRGLPLPKKHKNNRHRSNGGWNQQRRDGVR